MKCLQRLANVTFAVAAAGAIGMLGLALLLSALQLGGWTSWNGPGFSTIQPGSLVFASATEPRDLRVGDLITYATPRARESVIGQVASIRTDDHGVSFLTVSSERAAGNVDEVRYTGMAGKVTLSVPYAGYVVHALSSSEGRFLLIVMPGLLLIGSWLSEIWRFRYRPARLEWELSAGMKPDSPSETRGVHRAYSDIRWAPALNPTVVPLRQ